MDAYTDLVFGFGLARLGAPEAAQELLREAERVLSPAERSALPALDDVPLFLYGAYEYRIKQALEGKPHAGLLPPEQMEYLEHMDRMPRYTVDRLRQHARVLEPDGPIDPYRHWGLGLGDVERALVGLQEVHDDAELAGRIENLFRQVATRKDASQLRVRVLGSALGFVPRVGQALSRRLLGQVAEALDDLSAGDALERAVLLAQASKAALRSDPCPEAESLLDRFLALFQGETARAGPSGLLWLLPAVARLVCRLRPPETAGDQLRRLSRLVQGDLDLDAVGGDLSPERMSSLRLLLTFAGAWWRLGRPQEAKRLLQAAEGPLFAGRLSPRETTLLASDYADALGEVPDEDSRRRFEDLFARLPAVRDTYTTNSYFNLSALDVLDAVVLAAVRAEGGEPDPLIVVNRG
jgi:hypothetical protein